MIFLLVSFLVSSNVNIRTRYSFYADDTRYGRKMWPGNERLASLLRQFDYGDILSCARACKINWLCHTRGPGLAAATVFGAPNRWDRGPMINYVTLLGGGQRKGKLPCIWYGKSLTKGEKGPKSDLFCLIHGRLHEAIVNRKRS